MNANDLFNAVMQLDLEPIKTKLMHVQSGEGWSLEKANAVEKEYRRFLCLMKLYPQEQTAPLADVDTFWHYHILDTMKYAADCEQVFGDFLHHDPYVGLGGSDEDEQVRLDSGLRMQQLYEATFGEAYPTRIDAVATAWCASPVKHTKLASTNTAAVAWCASPVKHTKLASANAAAVAWCASPVKHTKLASTNTAAVAWCASPVKHTKLASTNAAAVAWCASPVKHTKLTLQETRAPLPA